MGDDRAGAATTCSGNVLWRVSVAYEDRYPGLHRARDVQRAQQGLSSLSATRAKRTGSVWPMCQGYRDACRMV